MLTDLKIYLCEDIWRLKLSSLPKGRAFWINLLRVCVLTVQCFVKNKCQLRASALTFYTLLSIVPVAALLFGIAKGYGFEQGLQERLRESLVGHEEVAERIIAFSSSMLENVKGGMIAGVGVAILLWTVIRLLGNIERSLNEIWGVQSDRPLMRKLSDYLSMVMICPFLIIISGSATVFAASHLAGLANILPFSETINTLIQLAVRVLPLVITWLVFTFIYVFMPNTKVRMKSALAGGVAAGTLYHVLQASYIVFQVGVSRYNAIYGSFAALPLFLIWLQVSWLIVLLGAEISFAFQNVNIYELDPGDAVSPATKKLFSLRIAREVVRDFQSSAPPPSDEELSQRLEIPIRTVRLILFELVSAGMLSEVSRKSDATSAYQPAMPPEQITAVKVIAALESLGDSAEGKDDPVSGLLSRLKDAAERSPVNKPLGEI